MGEGRKEMFIWVWWPERETESTFLSNTLSVLFPLSGCPNCAEESSSVAVGTSHPSLLPFCFLQCMALPVLLSWLLLSQQGLLWQKGGHLSRPKLRREARGITAETIGCKGLTFYGGLPTRQSALPVWCGQLKDPSTSGAVFTEAWGCCLIWAPEKGQWKSRLSGPWSKLLGRAGEA